MKNVNAGGLKFQMFDSNAYKVTQGQAPFEVSVNPKTGYIRFGAGILARRSSPSHNHVRIGFAVDDAKRPLVLVRFINNYMQNTSGAYKLRNHGEKRNMSRNVIHAPAFFRANGVSDIEPFVCEVLTFDDRPNDCVFSLI
jgi:hypothetical protein